MKVIFMGTPEFALPCLEYLDKEHNVQAVFTKPDKRNMRNGKRRFSPIKEYAVSSNIEVIQPVKLQDELIYKRLQEIAPDIIVVVAYGKIIPKNIIDLPKYGIINVHASLLPKYRGASPIQQAILNGDEKTGITIMYIEEGLDTGNMILKSETKIEEEDNFATLHDKLKISGAIALKDALIKIEEGTADSIPQNHSEASFVKPIKKEETKIDWNKDMKIVYNQIRAFDPFPGAFTLFNGKRFKIYKSEKIKTAKEGIPGEIIDLVKKKGPLVRVKDGAILIKEVKPENKKKISGQDIINGNYFKLGDKFED